MEKNDDFLNDLAVICDLIDKLNIGTQNCTLTFNVDKENLSTIFNVIQNKYGKKHEKLQDKIFVSIGNINIIFNMNNA